MPDRPMLDARLAEIDRRLRSIQSGLAPVAEPAPEPEPEPERKPAPPPEAPDEAGSLAETLAAARQLTGELRALRDEHDQVLAAARSLLSGLAEQLSQAEGAAPAGPPARGTASVTAGPFADAASLRRFAEAIRELPQVTGVEVREFIGGDRAVLDVQVAARTAPG